MRKRIAIALSTLFAAMLGSGIQSPSAMAAASCGSGYICWYDNSDGTGLLQTELATFDERSRCYTMPTTVTNRTSYIYNRSGYLYNVYDGSHCDTSPGVIYANSHGAMAGVWNNSITSYVRA